MCHIHTFHRVSDNSTSWALSRRAGHSGRECHAIVKWRHPMTEVTRDCLVKETMLPDEQHGHTVGRASAVVCLCEQRQLQAACKVPLRPHLFVLNQTMYQLGLSTILECCCNSIVIDIEYLYGPDPAADKECNSTVFFNMANNRIMLCWCCLMQDRCACLTALSGSGSSCSSSRTRQPRRQVHHWQLHLVGWASAAADQAAVDPVKQRARRMVKTGIQNCSTCLKLQQVR